jgi:hypothetical protein
MHVKVLCVQLKAGLFLSGQLGSTADLVGFELFSSPSVWLHSDEVVHLVPIQLTEARTQNHHI